MKEPPADIPVTTPVGLTLTTAGLKLDQLPPVIGSDSASVEPTHMLNIGAVGVIGAG